MDLYWVWTLPPLNFHKIALLLSCGTCLVLLYIKIAYIFFLSRPCSLLWPLYTLFDTESEYTTWNSWKPMVITRLYFSFTINWGRSVVRNPPATAGDTGDADSIPASGRSLGVGNGSPLKYSCLENPTDRRAWIQSIASQSQTQMSMDTPKVDWKELS